MTGAPYLLSRCGSLAELFHPKKPGGQPPHIATVAADDPSQAQAVVTSP